LRATTFSERIGAVRRALQKESMDDALRNSLWNVAYLMFWNRFSDGALIQHVGGSANLLRALWIGHFNLTADTLPRYCSSAVGEIKQRYLAGAWSDAYDFIEFIAASQIIGELSKDFVAHCNIQLEKHVSAYRFVETRIAPITSDEEIGAIEQAGALDGRFAAVGRHINTSLERLTDRSAPDYRNSIKESISAIEAACQILTRDPNATLVRALKKIGVHPALEKGFSKIYEYASDADGIRHAISEETTVNADDAKFFLVSCSAFVNYLIAKGGSS
jgi:hypothetical protein